MSSSQASPSPQGQGELERLKSLFLAALNHELRTPLAGLVGMTDLLLETNLDEEQREYANTARLCAQDLLRILTAALQYAALEADQVKLEESEFNVRELIEAAAAEHAPMAKAKYLALITTLPRELPPTLVGDGLHIKEVIGYLLSNAVKFTQHGMVELEALHADENLRITIRDTGIGIASDRRKQIFESFRQLDEGLTREYNGLGLGLTLANKLLRLMRGRMTVESEPSKGSVFTVEIPVKHRTFTVVSPLEHRTDTVRRPLILAVEDNSIGTAVIRHALKRYPIELHSAASGEEAIAKAKAVHYSLILMDLQMPTMSGLEAAAAIRKLPEYENVPILALTADQSDEIRRECHQAGMRGFLTKPIQTNELWASIQRELKIEQ